MSERDEIGMATDVKLTPFTRRIDAALTAGRITFYDLAMKLYPDPKSWRYKVDGGPPGCFMLLSAALRRGGYSETHDGPGPGHRWVYPRPSHLPRP